MITLQQMENDSEQESWMNKLFRNNIGTFRRVADPKLVRVVVVSATAVAFAFALTTN